MKPIAFPEQNIVWAKDQKEYLPLPAYTDTTQTISCWSFSWRERLSVLLRGRLWLRQLNFQAPLQPQLPSTDTPFL